MVMSRTLRTMLKCTCHSAHIFRCLYSSRATRRLLVDSGCSSPELCKPIQYCLACQNLSIPPDVKMSSKNTLHYSGGIIVFKKVSTADARCSSDQRCVMTEGFKPLYPVTCVSPHHLQRCQHGAKFKSSNCFCPTLYNIFITVLYHIYSDVKWPHLSDDLSPPFHYSLQENTCCSTLLNFVSL
jgi:hypothetical protein